jgi:hypothetical protein
MSVHKTGVFEPCPNWPGEHRHSNGSCDYARTHRPNLLLLEIAFAFALRKRFTRVSHSRRLDTRGLHQ